MIRWLDFMHDAGLSVWQMLPLGIPDESWSPYQSCSAFASDPGLLPARVTPVRDEDLEEYRTGQSAWIEDFALFKVLGQRFADRPWWRWPESYSRRDADALDEVRRNAHEPIARIIEQQLLLDRRWREIRREAADRGIFLFGDIPIFVAHESADVWARPGDYLLDDDFKPRYVAGVPPDYFSATGQRWGNPHYRWERMRADGFSWWVERFRRQFDWFDLVRLDHFRALVAVWMIDADCGTATEGRWVATPGRGLLHTLHETFGALPIVAEDLGIITEEVRELRRAFKLPGMAVLQFAFDGSPDNPHRPDNISSDVVAYTGTHDNNTCVGWFRSLERWERCLVFEVLGRPYQEDIARVMIEETFASAACLAVAPLQDFLGLGADARMNTPGVVERNWRWKFQWHQLKALDATRIRDIVAGAGRECDA